MKAIILFFLTMTGFAATAQSTIMKIDTVILEEFKTTDDAGTQITSYRRLTKKDARAYIEKIKAYNDEKADRLEMVNMEISILNDRLKATKAEKDRLQMEIQDNKRRIDEYKLLIK